MYVATVHLAIYMNNYTVASDAPTISLTIRNQYIYLSIGVGFSLADVSDLFMTIQNETASLFS